MSVLFLQGPYSFFFRDIAINLKSLGKECLAMVFNLGDRYLFKGIEQIDAHKMILNKLRTLDEIPSEKLNSALIIPNLYLSFKQKIQCEQLGNEEKEYFAAYLETLEEVLENYQVEVIVMQNDLRWQHALAIDVAKKLNVKYVVCELGLFRPNFFTMDSKGVNYNNSVPRSLEYYKNLQIPEGGPVEDIDKSFSEISERKRNAILASYILLHRLGGYLRMNSPGHKPILVKDYITRYLKAYRPKIQEFGASCNIPKPYIFAPFQVSTDSQTLVHSDFNNMNEFAETIIRGVKQYNQRNQHTQPLSVVFKEHPMDVGKVDYSKMREKYLNNSNVFFLQYGDTAELIENSELVITINSTVGIEALSKNRKVICLGRAFYAIEGIAFQSNSSNLATDIEKAIATQMDDKIVEAFLYYLRYIYQVPGDEYFYSGRTINMATNFIMETM